MSSTDWERLIPVLITAGTAISFALRKMIQWIYQYGYERAKAEDWKEQSKAAIETKNIELRLGEEENERLRQQIEMKDRTIANLSGGAQS